MFEFEKHFKQCFVQLFPKKRDETTSVKHMTSNLRACVFTGFEKTDISEKNVEQQAQNLRSSEVY